MKRRTYAGFLLLAALSLILVAWGNESRAETPAAQSHRPEAVSDLALPGGHTGTSLHAHDAQESDGVLEFHDAMRKLWEDHVTWTRLFIVSAAGDLPDLQATTDRLLQNQVDIGNAVKPYYGEQAGTALTELLTEHITTAATLLDAAKAGDQPAVAKARVSWYDNADRIAEFLSTANPDNWRRQEMRSMMREHLDLTLDEAVTQLTGDYTGSVAAYDQIHLQILEMADMLSGGIVAQFPDQFD